jgi:hypothetical protein
MSDWAKTEHTGAHLWSDAERAPDRERAVA